jgi:hypothetical protein
MRNLWGLEKNSILPLIISATGIVPQSLFKHLKILNLGNTLVVEIQKGKEKKKLLHSLGLVYKSMRGVMTNSIDRDQWLNMTSESRDRILPFFFALGRNRTRDPRVLEPKRTPLGYILPIILMSYREEVPKHNKTQQSQNVEARPR